ncbi:MAG: ATP-binding protein [bacterium]|nr:ATP-binding protein [bacterium]
MFRLDTFLVKVASQDPQKGQAAIALVNRSFRQTWAARAALAELSARATMRYENVRQLLAAPQELAWLPDDPEAAARPLRDLIHVRRHIETIAQETESATAATSDYNRLRRLNQAQASVQLFRQSFAALKSRDARRFIPVAEHWDRLIGDEIARLSAEREIKADIPNPYITGIPIQPDEQIIFAPRPDLVRVVENAITAAHGKPTLALYGPRRMGKTTFLLHLPRLLPDDILPVFVDLQEAVQASGLGGLYYNWAVAAWEAARDHRRLSLPRPDLAAFSVEPSIAWREWLNAAETALEDKGRQRKLFFTFDEFERLVAIAEKNPALEGAFDLLRHLSQHRPRVYLLFAGAYRLEELAPGGRWHDYFINIRGLQVSYLAEPDARRLLTNPIPDFPLDYAPGAVDEIIRLTHCQPYLVQLAGSVLVDWLNSPTRRQQGDWKTATLDDVAHTAQEILHVGRPYFANLWDNAGETGRQILALLIPKPDGLTQQELLTSLAAPVSGASPPGQGSEQSHPPTPQQLAKTGLPANKLQAELARLEQYKLIVQVEDRYKIQVHLTRQAFARRVKTNY